MASHEDLSISSDNWRWTGEPLNGLGGLHGSVSAIFPTFVLTGMFSQLGIFNPFYLFVLFWVVYIALAILARVTGYSPMDTARRLVIRHLFGGRYTV